MASVMKRDRKNTVNVTAAFSIALGNKSLNGVGE